MLVLVFTILGFLLRNISACSYLNIHTACICQCFLFLGMLIKRNELFLNSYIKRRVVYYGGGNLYNFMFPYYVYISLHVSKQ